jgi:hypothetical protein
MRIIVALTGMGMETMGSIMAAQSMMELGSYE